MSAKPVGGIELGGAEQGEDAVDATIEASDSVWGVSQKVRDLMLDRGSYSE